MTHHLPVSVAFVVIAAASILHARTGAVPTVPVELQPLAAQVTRVIDALDYLGAPLPERDRRQR
jgi:hypothetical protein